DDMCGTNPAVQCGQPFPIAIPSGGSITCSYSGALPGENNCTNVATASTNGVHVGGGSGKADVVFGAPTSVVDDCVSVDDSRAGHLGDTCAPASYTYSLPIRYDVCGDYNFDNVASFTTDDTKASGSSSWTVHTQIACANGCTLTQGYWKNHSTH